MRIAIYTLGCKVNQYESQAIAAQLENRGAEIVLPRQEADCYIVNTCAVTAKAGYQSCQALRRFKRRHPQAKMVATGCLVQVEANYILEHLAFPVCMVGNDQKHRFGELFSENRDCISIYAGDITRLRSPVPLFVPEPMGRNRAYLKVQDGCNNFCSYCVVPFARGRSRSLPPERVLEQMEAYRQAGVREVIVTGIHVGAYGRDLDPPLDIFHLLRMLCDRFPEIRFRLSSIEPTECSPEMLLWAASTENFCPHWHIPLQSGSTAVLRRMNRRYGPQEFMELTTKIRDAMPRAAIGTDVLVGFPGEGEKEFSETLALLQRAPITYLHAFPFSSRPGTLAAAMEETVTKREKSRRVAALVELGTKKKLAFARSMVGGHALLLVERWDKKRRAWTGHTENYLQVEIETDDRAMLHPNQLVQVAITDVEITSARGSRLITLKGRPVS